MLLPFIDIGELQRELAPRALTEEEVRRGERRPPLVFTHHGSTIASAVLLSRAARDSNPQVTLAGCDGAVGDGTGGGGGGALSAGDAPSPSLSHTVGDAISSWLSGGGREGGAAEGGGDDWHEQIDLRWSDGGLAGRVRLPPGWHSMSEPRAPLPPARRCWPPEFRCFEYLPPTPLPRHTCGMLPGASPVPPKLTMRDLSSVVSYSLEYDLLGAAGARSGSADGQGGARGKPGGSRPSGGHSPAKQRKKLAKDTGSGSGPGGAVSGGSSGKLLSAGNMSQTARPYHASAAPDPNALFGFSVL